MPENSVQDLGCMSNVDAISRFVDIKDKFVVDAGCGDLTVAKLLLSLGANVLAIDPDPVQAKLNREHDPIQGLDFVETGAELIPVEDQSVDGVFFSYSLHHVPAELYPDVFEEVFRILRPDGFLYVIEPTDCPLNDVMKNFHNEDAERAEAQRALQEIASPRFERTEVVTYHSFRQFESFDEFATLIAGRSFNTLYTEQDVRQERVQEAFERLGAPDYRFSAPKQVMFCQGLI